MKVNRNRLSIPLFIFVLLILVSLACSSTTPTSVTDTITESSEAGNESITQEINPPIEPTNTPENINTNTPKPTNTLTPSDTPLPPTATTNPNIIKPGTYLVGQDINPGLYKGYAGTDLFDSCYWERLKDLSGSFDSILANDNSIGQFYIEVGNDDYALQTACELTYLSSLPEPPDQFPVKIEPGMYLVGIDIQPGTYKGQAGTDISGSCYWERLKDLSGSLYSIIANDNSIGQFYVQVSQSDFALNTGCVLDWVGN